MEQIWQQEKKEIHYDRDPKFNEPSDWYTDEPASIHRECQENSDYQGLDYQPEEIKKNRRLQGGDYNSEDGSESYDPEVKASEIDETETEDSYDRNDNNATFSGSFWQVLGILIVISLLIFLIYQIIKNKKTAIKEVKAPVFESNWELQQKTKTELEILLENSLESENYRECVRIYFNFILKDLIKKGWIKWKKEKTNYHYILEMKCRPNHVFFEECVRIYDLVWYGDYEINKNEFETIQPVLIHYCQLTSENAE